MIATTISDLVPADFLACASCLLPERKQQSIWLSRPPVSGMESCRATGDPSSKLVSPLSPTENRVLPLVLAGLADKEIARVLDRSLPTVKHHVAAILRKNRVSSRARLIAVLREAADGNPEPELLRLFGT